MSLPVQAGDAHVQNSHTGVRLNLRSAAVSMFQKHVANFTVLRARTVSSHVSSASRTTVLEEAKGSGQDQSQGHGLVEG